MSSNRPRTAVKSLLIYRGPSGDPTVEAQLMGNGDLRLLSIQRDGVWMFSDVDTIGWWTWHTVSHADLPQLVGEDGDVLEAVRTAVAPDADEETNDEDPVSAIHRRFQAWLVGHGVQSTHDSWDEHEP